ncbi:hypothetical protein NEOLEDRAFT_1121516 [Neolentinus lepideus HHB14362 ss-1]|uniref:Zn(2)-C6 fungal-type domain-containing protein n=1 Tax=Neolentinus lepideus HHB14362 ss-1 TaxID=1314782 RepID=A0A165PKQ0_9AGAM|nr:hypothetical protein NEOLEDRAFT_1121516 [Neolentinus lepideus HHB14362 ss-1]
MPKVPSEGSASKENPNVLKRNQACHQCRRRKLYSDAKRPACSTCVRSHAHAVNHAPAGVDIPPRPECTYDEIPETTVSASEGPKSRYERLENRINELEALLRQKDQQEADQNVAGSSYLGGLPVNGHQPFRQSASSSDASDWSGVRSSMVGPDIATYPDYNFAAQAYPTSDATASAYLNHLRPPFEARIDSASPTGFGTPNTGSPTSGNDSHGLVWSSWSPKLPKPDLVRHLVDAFFSFHPHASRLFHAPTFMTSLSLPPGHVKFPNVAILHSICALASLYTAAVTSPPRLNPEEPPDELFRRRHKSKQGRTDTFADVQADLARDSCDEQWSMGENLLEVLQARVILTWFYLTHARWSEVYLAASTSMRISVACGLNCCPPFHTIANSTRPLSLLPRSETVLEDELRRNAFWLAYCAERLHGCGNGWALCLDDMDVTQLLPVRGDKLVQGTLVSLIDRQWAQSKDLFHIHPDEHTDSFTLYVKSVMLLSKVKNFNLRFRTRQFSADPATMPLPDEPEDPRHPNDPRATPAFIELDGFIDSFRQSFPKHLSHPVDGDSTVDWCLYTACLVPHTAAILLHEPHAEVGHRSCTSAARILDASRAILNLVYALTSTSYDISLLDNFSTFAWFLAGRILVRFLEAAQLVNGQEQIPTLVNEITYIRVAIAKMGERVPLAYRYGRMLNDLLVQKCGQDHAPPVSALVPRWPMVPTGTAVSSYYEAAESGTHFENVPVHRNGLQSYHPNSQELLTVG